MNNLSMSLKKFMGNKNTVTIIGVILIVAILYIFYTYRINQAVKLVKVPVATVKIEAGTKITTDMYDMLEIPIDLLKSKTGAVFYTEEKSVVNKYVVYNNTIAKGSVFYEGTVVDGTDMVTSKFKDIPDGYRIYPLSLNNISGIYGAPEEYIDIYFSAISEDSKVMFGQLYSGIQILAIVDENGNNAYNPTPAEGEEVATPATLYLAVPEELYIMFGRLERINEVLPYLNSHLVLTPNLEEPESGNIDIYLTSDDIRNLINENSQEIDKIKEKKSIDTTTE